MNYILHMYTLKINASIDLTKINKVLQNLFIFPQELKYWCQLIDECIAFDSKGRLYVHIPQRKNWRYPSKDTDFYVANIDICKAGITTCYGECTCNYTGKIY